jgi:hypothetical protein
MKKITIILLCALSTLLFGCGPKNNGPLPVLDVSGLFPEKRLPLQELAEVEYLPLETHDDFLLSGNNPAYLDEEIVVMTEPESGEVMFFDRRTGKALHKFNRKGRSGQEYTRIEHLTVDRANGEIFIFAGEGRMVIYDLQGNFRRRWKVSESHFSSIFDYSETELLVYDIRKNNGQSVYALSKQDGAVREIGLPAAADSVEFKMMMQAQLADGTSGEYPVTITPGPQLIRTAHGYLLGRPTASDTLYSLDPKEGRVVPALVREPSIFNSDPPTPLSLGNETESYFFLAVTTVPKNYDDMKSVSLIYDKKTGESHRLEITNNDYDGWESRLSGRREDYPPGTVCFALQAFQLQEDYAAGELRGSLAEIASRLTEDDNPVLMIAKFK